MTKVPTVTPVVLAGGSGARLWPLSSPAMPKQFVLKGPSGRSLFQEAVARVLGGEPCSPPLIVANMLHAEHIAVELAAIGCTHTPIIFEPLARNTAPAIALAALHLSRTAPDALMLVMPCDHTIAAPQALWNALASAIPAAQQGYLVTFGVTPTAPDTGYGYIRRGEPLAQQAGVYRIAHFIEKPDAATATALLADPAVGWNSGIFLMAANTVLHELQAHAQALLETCSDAYAAAQSSAQSVIIPAELFAACEAMAFDRAVMEKTTRGAVVPVTMGWADLGSWAALAAQDAQA